MYADRQGARLLEAFERPLPEELIACYNVAQVQGVLYAARELVIDLGEGADARLVFHYVKLLGLIYALERSSGGHRLRSEERRVGKEGRSRWLPDHEKKKHIW